MADNSAERAFLMFSPPSTALATGSAATSSLIVTGVPFRLSATAVASRRYGRVLLQGYHQQVTELWIATRTAGLEEVLH
jgi:hypothetical protein